MARLLCAVVTAGGGLLMLSAAQARQNTTGTASIHGLRDGSVLVPRSGGMKLTPTGESTPGRLGYSVDLSADGRTGVVGAPEGNHGSGFAMVVKRWSRGWIPVGPTLLPPGEAAGDEFGYGVAISGDGNTALIGSLGFDHFRGAAWVFVRKDGVWHRDGSALEPSGRIGRSQFGYSVALSGDGKTALVSGNADDHGIGAVWVFDRVGGSWVQSGPKLTPSGHESPGSFGWSVALSTDGQTAIVGEPYTLAKRGAAWVFVRSGTRWSRQGTELTSASQHAGDAFGVSVGLSADGAVAAVGASGASSSRGTVWVFHRSGTAWALDGSAVAPNDASGTVKFGFSVALTADGATLLIGGSDDENVNGAAWIFERGPTGWTQRGSKFSLGTGAGFGAAVRISADGHTALIGGPEYDWASGLFWMVTFSASHSPTGSEEFSGPDTVGKFGWGAALSSDGTTALVGAPADTDSRGAVWFFRRRTDTWSQVGKKVTGRAELGAGQFGTAVALSANGTTAAVGAPGDDGRVGAVWILHFNGHAWSEVGQKLVAGGSGTGGFGYSLALSEDGNTLLVGSPVSGGGRGAAWIFARKAGRWTLMSRLAGSDEVGLGYFGAVVSLSGDGQTALVAGFSDHAAAGAVWVFARRGSSWEQQGSKLTGAEEVGAGQFGGSLALSSDGNTALVGGFADRSNHGAVWTFTRAGNIWSASGEKLTPRNAGGAAEFGSSVQVSADGSTALVGGIGEGDHRGAIWRFHRRGTVWVQDGSTFTARGEVGQGQFGYAMSLSGDGKFAFVGAPDDRYDYGAVWAVHLG